MKQYRIFKSINQVNLVDINNIYYSKYYSIIYLACTLLINGNSYSIEGDDKKITEMLKQKLEIAPCLPIPTYGKDGNICWDGERFVGFDDENFEWAVENFALENNYIYPSRQIEVIKVNSPEEARKLKDEFERNQRETLMNIRQQLTQQRKVA